MASARLEERNSLVRPRPCRPQTLRNKMFANCRVHCFHHLHHVVTPFLVSVLTQLITLNCDNCSMCDKLVEAQMAVRDDEATSLYITIYSLYVQLLPFPSMLVTWCRWLSSKIVIERLNTHSATSHAPRRSGIGICVEAHVLGSNDGLRQRQR